MQENNPFFDEFSLDEQIAFCSDQQHFPDENIKPNTTNSDDGFPDPPCLNRDCPEKIDRDDEER